MIIISHHIGLTYHRGHSPVFHGSPSTCIALCPFSQSGNVIPQSAGKGFQPIPTAVCLLAPKLGYKYPISPLAQGTHAYAQCPTPERGTATSPPPRPMATPGRQRAHRQRGAAHPRAQSAHGSTPSAGVQRISRMTLERSINCLCPLLPQACVTTLGPPEGQPPSLRPSSGERFGGRA